MSKLRCKPIHLSVIIALVLCHIVSCPAATTTSTTKQQRPITLTSSPVAPQSHISLSGLHNVTVSGLPQPDFDVEQRVSAEEEPLQQSQQSSKKKKKRQKNTALKRALKEAARKGMEAMVDLYDTLEPTIKRKGEVLRPDEPGAQLSVFSAPHFPDEVDQRSRAAYAALYAAKKLKESCDVDYLGLGRQTQTKLTLRKTTLESLCPPRDTPRCLPASRRYRTHDGTCNNDRKPRLGSAQMPFHRFLQPDYSDGVENIRTAEDGGGLPSARFISLVVHGSRSDEAPVTMMLAQWGQFIDHDLTATSQPRSINGSVPRCCGSGDQHPNCLTIRVPSDDPWLSPLNVRCLEFLRSAPAQRRDCVLSWREQINQATSYLDASTVYASNPRSADSNRLFRDGLLIFGRGPPRDDVCLRGALANHCVRPGDQRSGEQPGLMAMHTVWVAEHNRIANELGRLNPHWSDEKLYQEARRIVGAMVQHITYREFLPLVLGREVCRLFDLQLETSGFYSGYDPKVNPTVANSFGAAAFRFGHSLVQGSLMRSDRNHRFMLTNVTLHEEFGKGDMGGPGSLHRLVRGMLMQRALKRDEFISAELTNHLFQSNSFPFGLDLAAINIQRGRDHGLPSYSSWRVPCGLSPIHSWRDLVTVLGPESTDRIRQAYQSVNDIDLFVGGLAERPVIGGLVGPTFACILAQQFSNLRKGDRFWYENGGFESSFTPAQLSSVRQVTLAQVLCRQVNGGTLQPHAFLPPDMTGNERQFCGEQSLTNLDLIPWTERDPLNKQHDLPLRPINSNVIALKPQLIPNGNTVNNKTKKKKNKNKTRRKKPANVAPKEETVIAEGIETKLDFDQEKVTKTGHKNMTLVAKTEGKIDTKLDLEETTKTKDKLTVTKDRPSDKLDFAEGRRTTLSTNEKKPTDVIESRSISGTSHSKTLPIVQWQNKDANTVHIAISWNNNMNWNGGQRPESKPLAPILNDKIGLVEDEVQFLTGTGGSGQLNAPTYPPTINNSPFSYDPNSRPPTTNNNNGPMTFWTVNDVPQVYDIRNTIKVKPTPVNSLQYHPQQQQQYHPQPTYYFTKQPTTTTQRTNLYYATKRPNYIYSSYKLAMDNDKERTDTSSSSSFSDETTFHLPLSPFSGSNVETVLLGKALPSSSSSIDFLDENNNNTSSTTSSTLTSTTLTTDKTMTKTITESQTGQTLLTTYSSPLVDLLTSSSTRHETSAPLTTSSSDHFTTKTIDPLLDYDEDYDTSTVLPPVLTDKDTEILLTTNQEVDEDLPLTQFDKDGYLRPEYMHFDQLTLDPEEKLNKDFKTLQLDDTLTNTTEPRRPALDIEADLTEVNTNEQKRETIAFVPLKIINSADRPDDWWIRDGPEKTPLPKMPEIVTQSDVSVELPKPMRLL